MPCVNPTGCFFAVNPTRLLSKAGGMPSGRHRRDIHVACVVQAALRAAMEGLQITGTDECGVPPGRMAVPLLRHQRLALAWMLQRERKGNPRGGILADDQGLGKTVSSMALIVSSQRGDDGDSDDDGSDSDLDNDTSDVSESIGTATASTHGSVGPAAAEAAGQLVDQPQQRRVQQAVGAAGSKAECEYDAVAASRDLYPGGTLILCPTAVLHQWARELQTKVAPSAGA